MFPDENGVNVQCLDQTHLSSECPHHKQLNAQTTHISDPETLQMLLDMELEKGSWEAVRAHASATTINNATPLGWDAMVTVAAMVILIGAGIQMFMPFLKSFGFMAAVVTTVTSFKWVIASTVIMPAVAVQQVPAGTGASMWLVSCAVISALMLGVIAVVNIVSHRYRNVVHNMTKSAWATPDTQAHQVDYSRLSEYFPCTGLGELSPLPVDDSDALDEYEIVPPTASQVLPQHTSNILGPVHTEPDHDERSMTAVVLSTRVVRPQARIRHRPTGVSIMLMFGLFFKSCGASSITTLVVVASAHIDFLNLWFLSMVWLTVEAEFYLCCTRGPWATCHDKSIVGHQRHKMGVLQRQLFRQGRHGNVLAVLGCHCWYHRCVWIH